MAWVYSFIKTESRTKKFLNRIRKLPQARGYRAQIIAGLFVVISIILACLFPPTQEDGEKKESRTATNQVGLSLYFGLILALAEFLRRISLFGEEICHLETRYEHKKMVLLLKVFGVELATSGVVLIDVIVFIICFYIDPSVLKDVRNDFGLSALVIGAYLFYFGIIKSNKNPVDLDMTLDQQPVMAAQGLACAHFLGYIKILFSKIKDNDNKDEDFLSRVEKFEKMHNIKFASRKLHVIVPDSCNINRPLKHFGMTQMDQGISLTVTRAGRDCCYEILVCKMEQENSADPLYVMVDVPRALVTLKDLKDAGYPLYSLHPSDLVGQVQAFGSKLQDLVRHDTQCCDHVDIIPVIDADGDSAAIKDDSCNAELARMIRNRILESSDFPTDVCITSL